MTIMVKLSSIDLCSSTQRQTTTTITVQQQSAKDTLRNKSSVELKAEKYPETTGLHHTWYNKGRKRALERCQCVQLQYRHHLGWFKKIVGFNLVIGSLLVLLWNEGKAIESSRSYHEGLRSVYPLVSSDVIQAENEGKLVHIVGYLKILEPLEDPFYGVSIAAVKLKRRVQMYQWVEERVDESSVEQVVAHNSTYKYSQMWKDKLIDSTQFQVPEGHENPIFIPVKSEVRINPYVYVGNFALGRELKEKFVNFIQFTGGERPETFDIKMHMGLYYHSSDIWNPAVGDLRLQFSFAGPTGSYVSVVAKQVKNELKPFYTESGAQIAFLHEGKRSHLEIFKKEHALVTLYVWIFRVFSTITSVFGCWLSSKTITLLNRRNQIVQNLMSVGPMKFSLITATCLCCSTAGFAWTFHKPLFAFLMVTFAGCLLFYYAFVGNTASLNNNNNNNNNNKKSTIVLPQYSQLY